MKIKTQRRTVHATAGILVVSSVGFLVWTVSEPSKVTIPRLVTRHYKAHETIVGPTNSQLTPLLAMRLQAPLDPPKPIEKLAVSKPNRVKWPDVTLDCIFYGPGSRLAVFTSNGKTFTCSEGDNVLGISIDKIKADSISVTFHGEQRLFRSESKSEESPKK